MSSREVKSSGEQNIKNWLVLTGTGHLFSGPTSQKLLGNCFKMTYRN